MAGIDEGINWGFVLNEARKEQSYLNGFGPSFSAVVSNFAQEMSFIWASGHAVDFGQIVKNKREDVWKLSRQYSKLFTNYINNAINIYKSSLGVYDAPKFEGDDADNGFSYSSSTRLSEAYGYKFEETKHGMSGMNKTAVAEAIERFQKNMKDFAERFKTNATGIHISIFDHAGAQKAAYNQMIEDMVKVLNDAAGELIGEAQSHVDEEIDNMRLAQNQTVNTFNA